MKLTDAGAATAKAPLAARVVRYRDLVPCLNAFIDTRTPGSEAKENFTIIGPGVSENPAQHVHIAEPHGFNVGGARQPPRCVNSQHSHETAETFVVHTGRWRFDFGEKGTDSRIEGGPGDVVSFPTNAFRGFTNIGEDIGFLWSVLGKDDPGRVTWAPDVFRMAKGFGLQLMENGALVDIAAGETRGAGMRPMPPTTAAQVASLDRIDQPTADGLVSRHRRFPATGAATLVSPVIGARAPDEKLDAGMFGWSHGFSLRRIDLPAGFALAPEIRDDPHVLFVHSGQVEIVVDDEAARLGAGDTVTVPTGAARRLVATADAVLFSVHRGDRPQPPRKA